MEPRVITIVSTKTQRNYTVTTGAETLSELKEAMDNAHIDYSDLDFIEGLSKTKLIADESQLPRDIIKDGVATNNLVIVLTKTAKKIANGSERHDYYAFIKNNSLAKKFYEQYGKSYTNSSTAVLKDFVADHNGTVSNMETVAPKKSGEPEKSVEPKEQTSPNKKDLQDEIKSNRNAGLNEAVTIINEGLAKLKDLNFLSEIDCLEIGHTINSIIDNNLSMEDSVYSNDELKNITSSITDILDY